MSRLDNKEYQTYFFILATAVIVSFVIYVLHQSFSERAVLPKKHERYDITEIYVSLADEVCNNTTNAPLTTVQYEACLKNISLEDGKRSDHWVRMEIPDLDWVLDNYRPSFNQTLKKFSPRLWTEIYTNMKTTLIGINIPAKYYEVNNFDTDFYRLAFSAPRSALVCPGGNCVGFGTYEDPSGMSFPLFVKEESKRAENIPTLVINHHLSKVPFSIELAMGVFVVNNQIYSTASGSYIASRLLMRFSFAFIFLGILLLCVWQTVIWKRYIDYSSFLFFVASIVLVSITYNVTLISEIMPIALSKYLRLFAWINLTCAGVYFAVACARWRIKITTGYLIPVIGIFTSALLLSNILPEHLSIVIYDFFQPFVGPIAGGISFIAAYQLLKEHKQSNIFEIAKREALRKRAAQEVFIGFAFIAFGFWNILNAIIVFGHNSLVTEPFNLASVIGVLTLMATIFHPNLSKLKLTLDTGYPTTEIERLKLLMNRKSLVDWGKSMREGIFIEFDLANSSTLASHLKGKMHLVIQEVSDMICRDLDKNKFGILQIKYMGDAVMFILNKKNQDLNEDLKEVIQLLKSSAARYQRDTYRHLCNLSSREELSNLHEQTLHIHLYLTRQFSLIEEKSHSTNNLRFDFISEEMNYLLKYSSKSSNGNILISGPKAHLEISAVKLVNIAEHHNLSKEVTDKIKNLELVCGEIEINEDKIKRTA